MMEYDMERLPYTVTVCLFVLSAMGYLAINRNRLSQLLVKFSTARLT